MLDPTVFAVPLLGAGALFLLSVFTSTQLVIDTIQVPQSLADRGYSSVVVGRMLTDELRFLNEAAQHELSGVRVYGTNLDASLFDLSEYFGFASVTNDVRNIVVGIPYYVRAEIVDDGGTYHFDARIYRAGKPDVQVVRAELAPGAKPSIPDSVDGAALRPLLHEAAVAVLTAINPYIVAVHLSQVEYEQRQWNFPLTVGFLNKMLVDRDPRDDHLAYELLGRLHYLRAEEDSSLDPGHVKDELRIAANLLHKSLVKEPEFYFANLTLGKVEAKLGDGDLADKYFSRAVAIEPNSLPARVAWGRALAREGRTREAIYQYVAAVEIDRGNASIRLALADLYTAVGRPDAARAQTEAAYRVDPRDDVAKRLLP